MNKTVEDLVFDGIRKTINRFREKPFFYFTEADIHSSLLNDMRSGGSGILSKRIKNIEVSLVHQEYPTNFRYKKENLLSGYEEYWGNTTLDTKNQHGDRGNFDLVILNDQFVERMIKSFSNNQEALDHIINKDIKLTQERMRNLDEFNQEILYAIEVKFLHSFNSRNKAMLDEVIKDNEKLRLAYKNSDKNTRTINLVFCSSSENHVRSDKKESVIWKIRKYIGNGKINDYQGKEYILPDNVLAIFIESFLEEKKGKVTERPIISVTPDEKWNKKLRDMI